MSEQEEIQEQEDTQKPNAMQGLSRDHILEKAKERLIEKEAKYLESLADMDVKLVVEKIRSAVIEQGKLVDLHQVSLEEHQILVRQANRACSTALEEADALRQELVATKTQLVENTSDCLRTLAFDKR